MTAPVGDHPVARVRHITVVTAEAIECAAVAAPNLTAGAEFIDKRVGAGGGHRGRGTRGPGTGFLLRPSGRIRVPRGCTTAGALRLRLVAVKSLDPNQEPIELKTRDAESGRARYHPNVVLDLDYTVLMPKRSA